MQTVHLKIQGRVQGVGYRYSTHKKATSLQLKGWVRNCSDGSVEALFQGEPPSIEEIIRWCHHGPSGAIVHEIQAQVLSNEELFQEFSIRY